MWKGLELTKMPMKKVFQILILAIFIVARSALYAYAVDDEDRGYDEGKTVSASLAEQFVGSLLNEDTVEAVAQTAGKAGLMGDKLTPREEVLFAAHPDKLERLRKSADYARAMATLAYGRDPNVPEDAYRHVLWSYLLTKEFGDYFAKQVTDAHESGSKNTPAQWRMDLNNNTIGRNYAAEGCDESEILRRVMSDPHVVRSP